MKYKKGYLLIESIMSMSIILIIMTLIYNVFNFTVNIQNQIINKVELNQHAIDISEHIEKIIKGANQIQINTVKSDENFKKISTIKCYYRNEIMKDKQITYKENYNKIFIDTIINNVLQSGGYEIGCYVEGMYIHREDKKDILDISLNLEKDNIKYNYEFKVDIKALQEI